MKVLKLKNAPKSNFCMKKDLWYYEKNKFKRLLNPEYFHHIINIWTVTSYLLISFSFLSGKIAR